MITTKRLYRERNVIERTFNRLKDFRRIHWPAGKRGAPPRSATRFDRKLKTYMAALCIVAVIVWWL